MDPRIITLLLATHVVWKSDRRRKGGSADVSTRCSAAARSMTRRTCLAVCTGFAIGFCSSGRLWNLQVQQMPDAGGPPPQGEVFLQTARPLLPTPRFVAAGGFGRFLFAAARSSHGFTPRCFCVNEDSEWNWNAGSSVRCSLSNHPATVLGADCFASEL